MTLAVRLELAGALKRRGEDVNTRIPKSTVIRQDLHAVRRAAGPTGAPRLVATDDTAGRAERFWAAALFCGAAETQPAVYKLHQGRYPARGTAHRQRVLSGSTEGDRFVSILRTSALTDHCIECGTIIINDPFRLTSHPAADSKSASYRLPGPAA